MPATQEKDGRTAALGDVCRASRLIRGDRPAARGRRLRSRRTRMSEFAAKLRLYG